MFNPSFLSFLQGLSQNNTTEWFDANRKTYEKEVKAPFAGFVGEMILRIQRQEPDVQIKPSDAIMRINRDIRFSKDKTPYNTYVAANISAYGKKDKSWPGFYFQLSPDGVMIYGGVYAVENDMLHRIRSHIAGRLEEFAAVCDDAAFQEKFGAIQGERQKRVPAEFQNAASREPRIANKQFYYSATLPPDLIPSGKLADVLMEHYMAGKNVNDFLKQAWKGVD